MTIVIDIRLGRSIFETAGTISSKFGNDSNQKAAHSGLLCRTDIPVRCAVRKEYPTRTQQFSSNQSPRETSDWSRFLIGRFNPKPQAVFSRSKSAQRLEPGWLSRCFETLQPLCRHPIHHKQSRPDLDLKIEILPKKAPPK